MIHAYDALHDPALLELMPTAVYLVDEEGRIRAFNKRACELWGRTPKLMDTDERFCGAFKLFLTDGTPLPHDETPMARAVQHGESCKNTEVVIQRPDGTEITVMVNISPLRDEQRRIVGAINAFQDVSEIVRARRELEVQRQALEKAVAARDAFLSICSHELKTPLTSLMFQSAIAAKKLESGDESLFSRENFLRLITVTDRQIQRLNRLVDDMLDVVRIHSQKLSIERSETDIAALVRDAVQRCAGDSGAPDGRVRVHADGPMLARIDAGRIEQVVLNLVMNGLKYGAGRPVDVTVHCNGAAAILSVRDEGIGIEPEDHARIFDRFERAVPGTSISGLGLGLYISREIVHAHGGKISVQSARGQGATFTVELPLSETVARAA